MDERSESTPWTTQRVIQAEARVAEVLEMSRRLHISQATAAGLVRVS